MSRLRNAIVILSALALLSGCATTRRIVDIHEHPTQSLLFLETIDTTDLFGTRIRNEHVFWQCVDRNNELQCRRQCGVGHPEFACPTGGQGFTNVR
jgi:hypothetical protein